MSNTEKTINDFSIEELTLLIKNIMKENNDSKNEEKNNESTKLKYKKKIEEPIITNSEDEELIGGIKYNPDKIVTVQNMTYGEMVLSTQKGSIIKLETFQKKKIRWSLLKEIMEYNSYRNFFENYNIIILEKKVRISEGLEDNFAENGADLEKFQEMLKVDSNKMINILDKLKNDRLIGDSIQIQDLRMTFLFYFLIKFNERNENATSDKLTLLNSYYKKEFPNLNNLFEISESMREENISIEI